MRLDATRLEFYSEDKLQDLSRQAVETRSDSCPGQKRKREREREKERRLDWVKLDDRFGKKLDDRFERLDWEIEFLKESD